MGFIDDAGMTGGALMIGWGMARPRTGNAQTETAFDSILMGGGAVLTAGSLAVKFGNANAAANKK